MYDVKVDGQRSSVLTVNVTFERPFSQSFGQKTVLFQGRTFLRSTVWFGGSTKESKLFFTENEAPRRASNHGPFYGNYGDK